MFKTANSIFIFRDRLLVSIRPPPSNVDENHISQLCTPNIEEGATSAVSGALRIELVPTVSDVRFSDILVSKISSLGALKTTTFSVSCMLMCV